MLSYFVSMLTAHLCCYRD